jgi:hypothetical protein
MKGPSVARIQNDSPKNKTIRTETALQVVRHVQDAIAGHVLTDEHLDSLELWVGMEEEYGRADGGAASVIRSLIETIRGLRSTLVPAVAGDFAVSNAAYVAEQTKKPSRAEHAETKEDAPAEPEPEQDPAPAAEPEPEAPAAEEAAAPEGKNLLSPPEEW